MKLPLEIVASRIAAPHCLLSTCNICSPASTASSLSIGHRIGADLEQECAKSDTIDRIAVVRRTNSENPVSSSAQGPLWPKRKRRGKRLGNPNQSHQTTVSA